MFYIVHVHKDNISISQGHIYTRCPGKDAIGTYMFQIFIQLIISGNRKLNLKAHFQKENFVKCDWPTQIFRWKKILNNNDIFGRAGRRSRSAGAGAPAYFAGAGTGAGVGKLRQKLRQTKL
jgi:hypothetical protein